MIHSPRVITARARIRRRQLATIVLVACVITPVFNVLTSAWSLAEVVQGMVDAVIITVPVGVYLLFVRDGWLRHWFRRIGFWKELVLSSAILLTLFLLGRAVGQVVTTGLPWRFLASFRDAHLAFALPYFVIVAVTMQFLLQMNRLVGVNVVGYFADPEDRDLLVLAVYNLIENALRQPPPDRVAIECATSPDLVSIQTVA